MADLNLRQTACQFCHGADGEHGGGCPVVGVKAGGGDDAIHALDIASGETMCRQDSASRNIAVVADHVDCWTCRMELNRRV